MELDPNTNYIVSGIERSGTSMLMQLLANGGIPVTFDDKRKPDEDNPKGYYELEGGKIINRLMEKTFPFQKYTGSFVKITAYGLKFLPPGNYKIIYSERNINEILDSMEKMAEITDENREDTKQTFLKLNNMIKQLITDRSDCTVLFLHYNTILKNPHQELQKIPTFLNTTKADIASMIETVDNTLYRQRHQKTS